MYMQVSEQYRHDIQALRGLAVIVVVLHHLNIPGFEFGYLGVDIFFVISGFVITKVITLQRDNWTLKSFYKNRLWRLLPALYTVLICILIAAFVSPDSFRSQILETIPYAATALGNIYFYSNTGYFSNESIIIPTLHTWSLAVEEQFYLLLAPIIAFTAVRSSSTLYLCIAFILSGLLAFTIGNNPNNWFYLLPSRAMELLSGSITFFIYNSRQVHPIYAGPINLIGTILIITLIPIFAYTEPNAIIAAISITFVTIHFLLNPGPYSQVLFQKNILFIALGEISYSLYLTHWPLISFAHINGFPTETVLAKFIIILISVLLAISLYFMVERNFYFKRKKTKLLPVPILTILAILLVTSPSITQLVFPLSRFNTIDYAKYFKENYSDRFKNGNYGSCFLHEVKKHKFLTDKCLTLSATKPNILLIGDSHAAYLSPGIRSSFPGFNIMQSTAVACPPLLGADNNKTCKLLNRRHFEFTSSNEIDIILVFANWLRYDLRNLKNTLTKLQVNNPNVVLIAGNPNYSKHLSRVLYDAASLNEAKVYADSIKPYREYETVLDKMKEMTEKIGISFVSIPELLCAEKVCKITDDNQYPIFYDYGHMTEEGANYLSEKIRIHIQKNPNLKLDL